MADHDPTTVDLDVLLAHAIAIQGHVSQAIPATPATDRHLRHAYGLLTQLADQIRDLRAAGRLLPEGGQTREEWRACGEYWSSSAKDWLPTARPPTAQKRFAEADHSGLMTYSWRNRHIQRRVVTDLPNGSTLIGPWEPVPDTKGGSDD